MIAAGLWRDKSVAEEQGRSRQLQGIWGKKGRALLVVFFFSAPEYSTALDGPLFSGRVPTVSDQECRFLQSWRVLTRWRHWHLVARAMVIADADSEGSRYAGQGVDDADGAGHMEEGRRVAEGAPLTVEAGNRFVGSGGKPERDFFSQDRPAADCGGSLSAPSRANLLCLPPGYTGFCTWCPMRRFPGVVRRVRPSVTPRGGTSWRRCYSRYGRYDVHIHCSRPPSAVYRGLVH